MVKKENPQVSPQIMSAVRPTAPLLQPTPEADAKLTQLAQKMGITREEVMDRILESISDEEQQKESFTDQSLRKIETARRLGLAGEDTSDPINLKARLKILKDMDKEDAMSMKEMLQMGLLLRILPPQDNQQGGTQSSQLQQMIADMKAENEKQRQFYEDRLKEQEGKIRDMVFEKKIENLGNEHASAMSGVMSQLEDLSKRVELIRSIPPTATPDQKKDAITQLEEAGSQLERIKTTLGRFGLIPAATPGVQTGALSEQGKEVWRNPDGSTNKVMFLIDRITTAVEKGIDAYQKKTPEQGTFVETPPPEKPKGEKRPPTPEEYAEYLLSKPSLSPQEQQWLASYREELLRQQERVKPPGHREIAPQPAVQPAAEQQHAGCRVCGRPEIYQEDLCEQCWNDQHRVPEQPKKSIVERLKEAEDEELKRTQGLI